MSRALAAALLGASSLACSASRASVEDATPPLDAILGDAFVEAESIAPFAVDGAARWWERFEDPELDALVARALDRNLDLRRAAATVREQAALARAAGADRGPTLDLSLAAERGFAEVDPVGRVHDTSLRPSLAISWRADLYGRLRASERAQLATLFAAESDRLALAHELVAAVVRGRVAVSVSRRRLDLAGDIVRSRRETLASVEARYARGVEGASAVAVRLARENLAAAESALPRIERELDQARYRLAELIGEAPSGAPALENLRVAALPALRPPPPGVPAGLVDRRPDLAAAQFRAEAAAASVDVAVADHFPDLVLSAAGGWDANDLEELLDVEQLFGRLAGDLTVRLFASGRLAAREDAARARLEGLALAYAAQVLRAVHEVEDALLAERRLREELAALERRLAEARLAEDLARQRYRSGLEPLLVVLDTERRRASAEDLALQLQGAVWNARADLHLALGGDWLTPKADDAAGAEELR